MKTRIDIELTKEEFEQLLFDHFALQYTNKHTLLHFYRWQEGRVDISIESESVHKPPCVSPATAERAEVDAVVGNAFGFGAPAGDPPPPKLWVPDPPFIHTTEVNKEEPPTLPGPDWSGFYPQLPNDTSMLGEGVVCHCQKYWVYAAHGWLDGIGQLHEKAQCESLLAADATAVLSASSTGEHGTVEADDDIPF